MEKVTANMAGMVLKVLVNVGEKVDEGQDLVILESMKMEVPIHSLQSGTVKEIKVTAGDFVNEGDVLLILE